MADVNPRNQFEEELDDISFNEEDLEHISQCRPCLDDLKDLKPGLSDTLSSNDSSPEAERQNFEVPPYTTDSLKGSITDIMQWHVCDWNTIPHASVVFNALKVNAYIVKPNLFLSANVYCPLSPLLNVDSILQNADPPWTNFEKKFDALLEAFNFDGCKRLADEMSDRGNAVRLLNTLQSKLKGLGTTVKYANLIHKNVQHMFKGVQAGKVVENLSQEYCTSLIWFFLEATHDADFRLCISPQRSFNLNFDNNASRPVTVDLQLTVNGESFLVGQFRKFKESESVKKPAEQTDGREDLSEVLEKKLSVNDKAGGEVNTSDSVNAHQNSEESCGFRKIWPIELHKVSCYLPHLLGGMLASLKEDGGHHAIPALLNVQDEKRSYDVQLGFTVDGFKLRFVRLVLCHNSSAADMPTVNDLRRPDVKCHVFITKEINLFHKEHLKLFFKYLYALAFVSRYGP